MPEIRHTGSFFVWEKVTLSYRGFSQTCFVLSPTVVRNKLADKREARSEQKDPIWHVPPAQVALMPCAEQ